MKLQHTTLTPIWKRDQQVHEHNRVNNWSYIGHLVQSSRYKGIVSCYKGWLPTNWSHMASVLSMVTLLDAEPFVTVLTNSCCRHVAYSSASTGDKQVRFVVAQHKQVMFWASRSTLHSCPPGTFIDIVHWICQCWYYSLVHRARLYNIIIASQCVCHGNIYYIKVRSIHARTFTYISVVFSLLFSQ